MNRMDLKKTEIHGNTAFPVAAIAVVVYVINVSVLTVVRFG